MSHIQLKGSLSLGKGSSLSMYEDKSKAPGCGGRFYTEVRYDGKDSSWVPVVGKHWHKYHDEWIEVISGRVSVYQNSKWTTMTPESGPLFLPRRTTHGFRFLKGEETVARERTEPTGEFKHVFFEDVFAGGQTTFLRAMRAFRDGDTYVALPLGIALIDEAFTIVLGRIAQPFYPKAPELGQSAPPMN